MTQPANVWTEEIAPELESAVQLIPHDRGTLAKNEGPTSEGARILATEVPRPMAVEFRVVRGTGEPDSEHGDIVSAIVAMRKAGTFGWSVVRVVDGVVMSVLMPVGSTAARVSARSKVISAKLAAAVVKEQEPVWPVAPAEDEVVD